MYLTHVDRLLNFNLVIKLIIDNLPIDSWFFITLSKIIFYIDIDNLCDLKKTQKNLPRGYFLLGKFTSKESHVNSHWVSSTTESWYWEKS
jgi:hypothetical protein